MRILIVHSDEVLSNRLRNALEQTVSHSVSVSLRSNLHDASIVLCRDHPELVVIGGSFAAGSRRRFCELAEIMKTAQIVIPQCEPNTYVPACAVKQTGRSAYALLLPRGQSLEVSLSKNIAKILPVRRKDPARTYIPAAQVPLMSLLAY